MLSHSAVVSLTCLKYSNLPIGSQYTSNKKNNEMVTFGSSEKPISDSFIENKREGKLIHICMGAINS